jgi:GntR family transcriptional regulator, rspAB operon transcriptional repressor
MDIVSPQAAEDWLGDWQLDRSRSIKRQVYATLRRAIVEGRLLPGRALSEQEFAERLGVSRTPVREALSKLADDLLVSIFPQAGSFVAPISYAAVVDAEYIREALECAVVADLARTASEDDLGDLQQLLERQTAAATGGDLAGFHALDEGFHKRMAERSGHPSVWPVIDQAKLQIDRVRMLSLPDPGRPFVAIAQHRVIVEALEARQPAAATRAMRRHLREVIRILDELRSRQPSLFLPTEGTAARAGIAVPRRQRTRAPLRHGYRFGSTAAE